MKHKDEEVMQHIVVRHLNLHHPDVLFTCSPGNQTNPIQGHRMRLMGYRKGWLDLFIAKPCKGYAGFFIELKTEKGKVSPEQELVIDALLKVGYKVSICRSAHVAICEIDAYLGK